MWRAFVKDILYLFSLLFLFLTAPIAGYAQHPSTWKQCFLDDVPARSRMPCREDRIRHIETVVLKYRDWTGLSSVILAARNGQISPRFTSRPDQRQRR
jgi:hypothetical protein